MCALLHKKNKLVIVSEQILSLERIVNEYIFSEELFFLQSLVDKLHILLLLPLLLLLLLPLPLLLLLSCNLAIQSIFPESSSLLPDLFLSNYIF
jgi:hypothetical protein